MRTMDCKLKTYSSRKLSRTPCNAADRLTSLPDELLGQILSMLSTKDVAATVILCKRMRKCLCWISSIDLDDSPIIHCSKKDPYLVDRFTVFQSFVDNILRKFSPPYNDNTQLMFTRFRLHFGGHVSKDGHCRHDWNCQPNVLPATLNAWISCPVVHFGGLTELDLSFYVSTPFDREFPRSLFASQSLKVLRLASNIAIDNAKIPVICFPNLKLIHLCNFIFNDDDFVGRLVSGSPVLEHLSIDFCLWQIGDRLSISSPSLHSIVLIVDRTSHKAFKCSELVRLNTPNLQYFKYHDNVAARYSIAHMDALVKASILVVDHNLYYDAQLSLLSAMSNVQDLSIYGSLIETLYFAEELMNQLPVFRNLRSLQLAAFCNSGRWDVVLLLILHRSPSLETLVFEHGLFSSSWAVSKDADDYPTSVEDTALEAEGWRTAAAAKEIPSCCLTHLKRIVIKSCMGSDRELNTIKFLLANSLVLEELDICITLLPPEIKRCIDPPNLDQFENDVKHLPRASVSCLITLQRTYICL